MESIFFVDSDNPDLVERQIARVNVPRDTFCSASRSEDQAEAT